MAQQARRRSATRRGVAGWVFLAPAGVLLGLFLVVPIAMAFWVSISDWRGVGNPMTGSAQFVGATNYTELLGGDGLATKDFGRAMRNNVYYVLAVVPLQTILALTLAVLVHRRVVAGRGFFRSAFYFPSVTSSVAITVVFLFLFSATGAMNRLLAVLGVEGPNWFADPRGVVHLFLGALGVRAPYESGPLLLGLSWWNWISGPSVAMCVFIVLAVFTTSGTFMLLFLAALQHLPGEVEEAAVVDGATPWQRLRRITVPMLRPTLFTVITLGLIGTWQMFDQVYTGTGGTPGKTTLTPAYLSYQVSFEQQEWGRGAAIAFLLFAIIVACTLVGRRLLGEREDPR
nr:sugar ABC transporter permease [Occultella kanbiaonis]